ncbi:ATP-dependent DNA helicase PcrA [Clostridium thermopalmarium DSM 5974]|uniref:ATP-dependent DNA helicase PcrA n=3 Tax=Clostridium TaxID=1485 RepID=A0A151ANU2_9CLOT|nr:MULTISPECIES: UvrD-helicase domain-containing protein [Clostridium]KYH29301.1 ATP-dependent DNA helicase PcrA [Clostridium colicanis DSM 13634]PRR70985.1 ATP-dependent DNA helicase PcrA [Clostridium thermopalmarium DSM 5974]PVZ28907.1 DNA helicase-2/ATP-dependent DNA helicase PcrA [Clostridium thermopalmarium DSM 5974]
MDLKSLLNKEQYEAAVTIEGPVLVLAGAGSGKTRVLTYRIAHMIQDLGIPQYNILAITFTNKAAEEMKDRIRGLVKCDIDNMWVSTFHSSCVRILRREIDKLGYSKNFAIYDSSDQKTLIKQCMKELNINDKDISEKEIINKISEQKDNLISPEEYKKLNERDFRKNKIADVYLLYQKKLKSNNALDFDDLIYKTVELFKKNPEVLEFYQNKFKYIMVDEYQDTNKAQYELVKMLASAHKNIFVVGDDDQCLPGGSLIHTDNGIVKIEDVLEGQQIYSAAGNGEVTKSTVEKVLKKEYKGTMIRVKTKGGREISATPNHITFTSFNIDEDLHYVYLMYKSGVGYRIGQNQRVRNIYKDESDNGLAVILNMEEADKIWIIKTCETKSEASYYEQYYSVKYGIPTAVFRDKDGISAADQEYIDKLFKKIDTYSAAEKLMEDLYLFKDYPHYFSSAVTNGEASRKIINIDYFSSKNSEDKGYYCHKVSFTTFNEDEKKNLLEDGFNTRHDKENTWIMEMEKRIYDEAEALGRKLCSRVDGLSIIRKAKFVQDKLYYFMPFGSLRPGMSIATYCNGKIEEDIISEISCEDYEGIVYDLSIPELRQYIANDVVVHNCIYQWRGADIKNILEFEKDYPEAKVVKLEQNYRSKANILNAANAVIKNNSQRKSKVLRTENESGEKIKIYRAYSDIDEGNFIANEINRIMEKENRSYRDFAILYRTNAQSRVFEDVFMKRNIPYRILGGLKFYDRKEIKDITAYLKFINNLQDDISLRRIINVPKRGIGAATIDKIQEYANYMDECMYSVMLDIESIPGITKRTITAVNKFTSLINSFNRTKDKVSVSKLIEEILESTGYLKALRESNDIEDMSRIENIKELVSAAVDFENTSEDKSLSAFLEKITLVSDVDNYDENADTTVMMTLHSAKGLEFPVVFMVGMENGIFPGLQSLENFSEMEESRRLCYVGITRAKEKLYMTSASTRNVFGRTVAYSESDFLSEISPELKELVSERNMNFESKTTSRGVLNGAFGGGGFNSYSSPSFGTRKAEEKINSMLSDSSLLQGLGENRKKAVEDIKLDEITPGRKVKHDKFGIGTIVSASKTANDVKITVAFDNMGIKHLMFSMAPIKLI